MTILVAVLAVVLVLVVAVATARRRRGSEAHTVAGYRRTLDTLAGLSRAPGAKRLVGGRREGPPSAPDTPAEEGSGSPKSPGPGPDTSRRWAFDDVGSGSARVRSPGAGPTGRDIGRALRGASRGSRSRLAVVAATAVVAVVVVVVVLALGHHPKANGAGATGSKSASTHGTHHGTTTTTTTLPAREQPASSTANTATYVAPTSAYVLTLAATSGNCWMQVTDASGTTVFAQTVSAGTRHAVTVSGPVTVLLGAPTAAAVAVDHVPAVLPTGFRSPFTMTFTPSSAGATG